MKTADFLRTVITSDQPGYFCLAVSNGSSGWLENWFKYPEELDRIVARADDAKSSANVYFSSYLFKAPQSTKANVLPSRTIQADLDDADITRLPKPPTVLVETSPGRHQGYWVINEQLDQELHEAISKKLTYSIPLCDRSGWPLGKKVRIPGTFNYKYPDGPKQVHVVSVSTVPLGSEEFEALPDVNQSLTEHFDESFIEGQHTTEQHPVELLERIKHDIPVQVYLNYDRRQDDRSEALWALMCWAFKAGLNREEVFALAQASANNKYKDNKYRAEADLSRDVLRAEHAVKINQQDPKLTIYNIQKSSVPTIDKRRSIYSTVIDELRKQGIFLHTTTAKGWYIRRDIGRPVAIEMLSERLKNVLDVQFGLNQTEPESKYTIAGLKAYISTLPDTATEAALSRYDPQSNTMLLHTGKRTVIKITPTEITAAENGCDNTVFPWISSVEPFTPNYRAGASIDWGDELFGDGTRGYGSGVDNITNMTPAQAIALFKTWFLFVLFRDAANTRPIIANIGQPGSGKTCIFKRVYTTLYGRRKSIGAVTTQEDFDHTVSSEPLLVLDNVDTWEKWLPDRLALSAGTTDHNKRKLYSDTDSVTMRRQAIIGVTAHNPKFGREDVADRFLLFTFSRFKRFISEEMILADLNEKRNALWGAIIRDIQRVLQTPLPESGIPQFRIEDFARYGLWIARALGCEVDFKSAIEDVKSAQQTFSLEEEGLLVGAITKFVERTKDQDKAYTSAQLWGMLEASADDPHSFKVAYRNSVVLGKKLSAMEASLKKIIDIEQGVAPGGVKTWTLRKKDGA